MIPARIEMRLQIMEPERSKPWSISCCFERNWDITKRKRVWTQRFTCIVHLFLISIRFYVRCMYDQYKINYLQIIKKHKETKLKDFQFKLIHRTIFTRKELFWFGGRMMNVYTEEIKIQLSTASACLSNCLAKKYWTGSTKWMRVKSLLSQRGTLFGITTGSDDTTLHLFKQVK